jgi:hypothetical protein
MAKGGQDTGAALLTLKEHGLPDTSSLKPAAYTTMLLLARAAHTTLQHASTVNNASNSATCTASSVCQAGARSSPSGDANASCKDAKEWRAIFHHSSKFRAPRGPPFKTLDFFTWFCFYYFYFWFKTSIHGLVSVAPFANFIFMPTARVNVRWGNPNDTHQSITTCIESAVWPLTSAHCCVITSLKIQYRCRP